MIAYFELDLVLHAATCEKKKKKVKKVKTARKPCGSAVRLKEEKFAKKTNRRRTYEAICSWVQCQERLQDALRERLDLGNICAACVRNRGQAVRVPGWDNHSFRFGETNEYDQKKG